MLSVIIPTEGIEQATVATLAALVPGAAAGVIREVLLVDRAGNNGVIARVADVAGCRYLPFEGARAAAMAKGAGEARAPWLMFLHAGAVLDPGWIDEIAQFMQSTSLSSRPRAGIFRYARSPYGENGVRDAVKSLGRAMLGPSADQGLLIAKDHYERLGGHVPDAPRAETRLLRKLGRSSRTLLRSRIVVAQ